MGTKEKQEGAFRWQEYAPGCWVLSFGDPTQWWVFGMKWLPTVGARSRNLLLKQLRRERVRWWTEPPPGSGTLGFLPITQTPVSALRKAHLQCAAVQFALKHASGPHMLLLTFRQDQHWVVAVNDGNVLCQTDCWVDSLDRARDIEQTIRQRFSHLQFNHHDLSDSDLASAAALQFLRDRPAGPRVSLRRLRWSPARPAWIFFVAVLCLVAWKVRGPASAVQNRHEARQARPTSQGQSPSSSVSLSRPSDLRKIAQIWEGLSIDPPGWLLERVSCVWQKHGHEVECRAAYRRTTARANNQHLQSVMSTGWQIVPDSIDRTEVTRSLEVKPMRTRVQKLASSVTDAGASSLTALQDLSAFADALELGYAVSFLEVAQAPEPALARDSEQRGSGHLSSTGREERISTQAQQMPIELRQRAVRVSLPLRELSRIEELSLAMRWKAMHLEVMDPRNGQMLKTRLRIYLEGDLIEQP